MTIKNTIIVGYLIVIVISFSVSLFSIVRTRSVANAVQTEIPQELESITTVSRLDGLAQMIRFYDEVLTQSARNYAFTGDRKWRDRYYSVVDDLDRDIASAMEIGWEQEKEFFRDVKSANDALVEMEERAINFVDSGNRDEAVAILDGDNYWKNKGEYSSALSKYLSARGAESSRILSVSTESIGDSLNRLSVSVERGTAAIIVVAVCGVFLSFFVGFVVSRTVSRPIARLIEVINRMAGGDESARADTTARGEIGKLSESFNRMAQELSESRKNIEEKVLERTAELERASRLMVGRELKMIKMKEELRSLKERIGSATKGEREKEL